MTASAPLGWFGIARLGLVQAAIGAVVVLATSTLNRVMVVEWSLPAIVPGALVALHYGVQVLRPRLGYGSDLGGRRTPWIVGGMAALAAGGVAAAAATAWMGTHPWAGVAAAVLAYAVIGVGVGAAGTSLLVLLAKRVAPHRRAAAASLVWIMMIAGFGVTAGAAGHFLDPFSPRRLVAVIAAVGAIAFVVSVLAVAGLEGGAAMPAPVTQATQEGGFGRALAQVWAEPQARRFAIFVFASMLAYSAQELILEPFAGAVFRLTPGESAGLTGVQHAGALLGMLLMAGCASAWPGSRLGAMRTWTVGGCVGSAAALLALGAGGFVGAGFPLRPCVFVLGAANGAFAVAAIGAMMGLAQSGSGSREGVRMGMWGAAQAVAFAFGGLLATVGSDAARALLGAPAAAYGVVFAAEAGLFVLAAWMAAAVFRAAPDREPAAYSAAALGGVVPEAG